MRFLHKFGPPANFVKKKNKKKRERTQTQPESGGRGEFNAISSVDRQLYVYACIQDVAGAVIKWIP